MKLHPAFIGPVRSVPASAVANPSPHIRLLLLAFVCALLVPCRVMAGTWTPLAHTAPSSIGTMLLLSDGTVLAQQSGVSSAWYRLTPDTNGSYVTGTWSTLASMHSTRLYYTSQVLTDGRVFVAGAEYGTGWGTAEVYDPVSNIWTQVTVPPGLIRTNSAGTGGFWDMISEIVANGDVLMAPVYPANCGETVIYNPTTNTLSAGPTLVNDCDEDEASWVKLPDDSILTIDPFSTDSERYIPSLNQWVNDATVPVSLWSTLSELGAAFLLPTPTNQAFFLGGDGSTALYTPTGTTSPGTWTTGPNIPNGFGINDAPAAMMVNGSILCAVGSPSTYDPPTSFYEYNPFSNSFTQVSGPTGTTLNWNPYDTRMLDLPDGSVLFSWDSSQLYEYQPGGSPLAAGMPTIISIIQNSDGSYLLTGTLLNGISEGAAYGDDAQMNSNYPIVRMMNANGQVYFARTINWSSTGVMTGTNLVTTDFAVPSAISTGTYSVVVIANGISSVPVLLQIPESAPPFRITSITIVGNTDVNLIWNGQTGSNVVQVSNHTSDGNYTTNFSDLATIVMPNPAVTNYTNSGGATNFPSRFYRIDLRQ